MENKTKQPELLLMPVALMNEIIIYLNEKPYKEVANYINAIQKESKLVDYKAVEPPEPIEVKKEVSELDQLQFEDKQA